VTMPKPGGPFEVAKIGTGTVYAEWRCLWCVFEVKGQAAHVETEGKLHVMREGHLGIFRHGTEYVYDGMATTAQIP
jgi:hypothetical protein